MPPAAAAAAKDENEEKEEEEDDAKRRRTTTTTTSRPLRLVVFSGAGLSASTGMSTFSTPGGLYDRAKKALGLPASGDGSRLFHYRAFASRENDVHRFLAELAAEAARASPGQGHRALARLADEGLLARHYTMNVDGLAEEAGMRLWDWDRSSKEEEEDDDYGSTVELHGNVRRLVCRSCGARGALTPHSLRDMREDKPLRCPRDNSTSCPPGSARTGILLYDDADAALITPAAPTWRQLERDLARCAAVLWLGISFEQSASVGYFSRVVGVLRQARDGGQGGGKEEEEAPGEAAAEAAAPRPAKKRAAVAARPSPLPPQILINPSEDAMFNLLSGAGAEDLGEDVPLVELRMDTDEALPAIADRLRRGDGGRGVGGGGGNGAKSGPE